MLPGRGKWLLSGSYCCSHLTETSNLHEDTGHPMSLKDGTGWRLQLSLEGQCLTRSRRWQLDGPRGTFRGGGYLTTGLITGVDSNYRCGFMELAEVEEATIASSIPLSGFSCLGSGSSECCNDIGHVIGGMSPTLLGTAPQKRCSTGFLSRKGT